ncbi:MAG: redoxin domain-containing protein [Chlorobiales bacterium]|nr:redoxin domain-containing protein [Chlorobiales bacterium]
MKFKIKMIVVSILLIAIVVYLLVQIGVFDTFIHGDDRLVGKTAPPFTLKAYDDSTVMLSDYKNNVILIVFWSPT